MPRRRYRATDPLVRDRNQLEILGAPGLSGLSRLGGRPGGTGTSNLVVRGNRGDSGQVRMEHVTLYAEASQTIANGGAGVTWDRYAAAPTEIRGFATAADKLATSGSIVAIPIDVTGVLNGTIIGRYATYRAGGTAKVTLTRQGADLPVELDDDLVTSRRPVILLDNVEVQSGDTLTVTLPNGSGTGVALTSITAQLKVIVLAQSTGSPVSYPSVVLVDGPILYWRFEETSGTTAADASGNGHTGTYSSGPTLNQSGIDNSRAVALNGASSDYVEGPTADADLQFAGTAPFTVEAWVKPDVLEASLRTLACHRHTGVDTHTWLIGYSSGGIEANRNTGTDTTGDVTGSAPTVDVWNHIVWTYDGTTQRLYLNGTEVASAADAGSVTAGDETLRFGARDSVGIDGTADEFALYDFALSANQIAYHYQIGSGS